jgi:uncharacterized protein YggE
MSRLLCGVLMALAVVCLPSLNAQGQMAGSRAGLAMGETGAAGLPDLPLLDPKIAEGYMTVEGRAEVRVRPTEIRVVLAVTSEAETAQKCQQAVETTVEHLKVAWSKMGIAPGSIVVDFIAVLPQYAWSMEKHDAMEVGVEKKVGYRMQTNLHLAVQKDSQAQAALARAFEEGVTDIIAFDYWSGELDGIKVKARGQALKAARDKADTLFTALFHDQPPIINVQEQTTVRYPESLYHSFVNSQDERMENFNRNVPFIHASRPRNTYYRGLYSDGDVQPRELPMNPEISVISTVRLYFKSPAAGEHKRKEKSAHKG